MINYVINTKIIMHTKLNIPIIKNTSHQELKK
jgi:hypothetical protein